MEKRLNFLYEYFRKNFPNFHVSGTGFGMSWAFTFSGNVRATIRRNSQYGFYNVRINDNFFYPKSMTEAFQILKETLQ